MMRKFLVGVLALPLVTVVVSPAGVVAQAAKTAAAATWTHPRTSWGDPELQGTWNNATRTPLERPSEFAEKPVLTGEEAIALEEEARSRRDSPPRAGDPGTYNAFWSDSDRSTVTTRTSLIVDPPDGRIPPLTPEAKRREAARADVRRGRGPADSYEDRNRWERCLARGLPMAPGPYNNTYEILQIPGSVVIVMEMIHDEFTMDDPQTFTRPWTALVPMVKTDDRAYEYGCHEGNYGLPNILRGARADDAAGRRNLGEGSWTAGR